MNKCLSGGKGYIAVDPHVLHFSRILKVLSFDKENMKGLSIKSRKIKKINSLNLCEKLF